MAAPEMTTADFLHLTGADTMVEDLKNYFNSTGKPLHVSDVKDEEGHQYVDLVQEGGGVLGIALVGYTYVLEKMGIRFFSMAGTSAGSINTMLLACAGNKEDEKSPLIVDHLVKLDMFSFVDGKSSNWRFTRWIKKVVQQMLLGSNWLKKIFRTLKWIMITLLVLMFGCFIINFIKPGIAKWIGVAAGVTFFILAGLLAWGFARFKQFAGSGYGLNQGKAFHDWINNVIEKFPVEGDPANGYIKDFAGFSQHFMRVPPGLQVAADQRRSNNIAPYMPVITIVTCDIIAERKIEFPRMWDLYWNDEKTVRPGDFVRASMSIPVFFEAYSLNEIRQKSSFAKWDQHLNWQNEKKAIPDRSQFIDGGTLSNFPINVFYNPQYPVPRMPTFGIRLQDGVLDIATRENKNLMSYVASLFSTIRFNYDRDFITKNRAYNLGVKLIDVRGHSWLNFFMKNEEKVELFKKGAAAAVEFLKTFDWEAYKTERRRNFDMQEEQFENPNNMEVFPFSEIARL